MDRRDSALETCVKAMWECYQEVARTPKDDKLSKVFIRARDLHEAIIRENGDNKPSHVTSLMRVCKALLVNAVWDGKTREHGSQNEYTVNKAVIDAARRIVKEIEEGR